MTTAHTSAATSDNSTRYRADPVSKFVSCTPRLSPAKAIAVTCYAITALLWSVSVFANVVGAFNPGAPPQGALLVAVLAVVAATGIVLVPVGKQYFIADAGRGTRFVIAAGNVFCLVLTCLLSYGTASSARLEGAGHNAEVAGRKQSAKQDEDDARAALKRYASTPPTETLQARIDALKNTPGIISDCVGPQNSQIAREACRTIGQLRAQLGDARARDAAAARLETAQGKQLVYTDQTTRVDNMTKVVQAAAAITGRTWAPERATDMASLVSVIAVEGLLSFFSMCGAAAWSSSTKCFGARLDDWTAREAAEQQPSDPAAPSVPAEDRQVDWTPTVRVPVQCPQRGTVHVQDTGHVVSAAAVRMADTLPENETQAFDRTVNGRWTVEASAVSAIAGQVMQLLTSRGGTLVTSYRALGNLLGCSKTAIADTLAALVAAGACRTTTTPKGTVIQLLQTTAAH